MGNISLKRQSSGVKSYFIDASNVCYWKDTSQPTLSVLLELIIFLKKERKSNFYCVFDANFVFKIAENEKTIYQQLLKDQNHFYKVSGGKRADGFVLELADTYNASVISNDNYNDDKYARYTWKDRFHKPQRLFMGEVIPVMGKHHFIINDLDIHLVLDRTVEESYEEFKRVMAKDRARKKRGYVKVYNEDDGYGFITYTSEIYFHKKACSAKLKIHPGRFVDFDVLEGDRGPMAANIRKSEDEGTPSRDFIPGEIVSYDRNKGQGQVRPLGEAKSYFFHRGSFQSPIDGIHLKKGDKVGFVIGENDHGKIARKLITVNVPSAVDYYKSMAGKLHDEKEQLENRLNAIAGELSKISALVTDGLDLEEAEEKAAPVQKARPAKKEGDRANDNRRKPKANEGEATDNNNRQQPKRQESESDKRSSRRNNRNNGRSDNERNERRSNQPNKEQPTKQQADAPNRKDKSESNANNRSKSNRNNNEERPARKDNARGKTRSDEKSNARSPRQGEGQNRNPKDSSSQKPKTEKRQERSTSDKPNNPGMLIMGVNDAPTPKPKPKQNPIQKDSAKPKPQAKKENPTPSVMPKPEQKEAAPVENNSGMIILGVGSNDAPKSSPNNEAPIAKRGSDIPPKAKPEVKEDALKAKRSPGRPPKAKPEVKDEAPRTKRGPGRPPKAKSEVKEDAPKAKRGPGRPPKAKPEVKEDAPKAKRGPGRPPKAKPEATDEAPKAKRGPGRPRKTKPEVKDEAPKAKRGPGRPPKVKETAKEDSKKAAPASKSAKTGVKKSTAKSTSSKKQTSAKKSDAKEGDARAKKPTSSSFSNDPLGTEKKRSTWWRKLSTDWKKAFNVVVGNGEVETDLSDAEIQKLARIKRLSFKRYSKNALKFKLTDLSGLTSFTNITSLNLEGHAIKSLKGLEYLVPQLEYLNLYDNALSASNIKKVEALDIDTVRA